MSRRSKLSSHYIPNACGSTTEIVLRTNEITGNANLMQQGSFIYIFLARHVSCTYAHHQEH